MKLMTKLKIAYIILVVLLIMMTGGAIAGVTAISVNSLGKQYDVSDSAGYDVIYNPKKTVLIKDAQAIGLRTITGLDMLIYQAVAAQEIWFGQTPDFKDMKIAALEAL